MKTRPRPQKSTTADRADTLVERALSVALKAGSKSKHKRALNVASLAIQWRSLANLKDGEDQPRALGFVGAEEVGVDETVVDLVDLRDWEAEQEREEDDDGPAQDDLWLARKCGFLTRAKT